MHRSFLSHSRLWYKQTYHATTTLGAGRLSVNTLITSYFSFRTRYTHEQPFSKHLNSSPAYDTTASLADHSCSWLGLQSDFALCSSSICLAFRRIAPFHLSPTPLLDRDQYVFPHARSSFLTLHQRPPRWRLRRLASRIAQCNLHHSSLAEVHHPCPRRLFPLLHTQQDFCAGPDLLCHPPRVTQHLLRRECFQIRHQETRRGSW
jgi:hypothetical protein